MIKEKITRILNHMIHTGGALGIKGYEERPSGAFQLDTRLSEYGHKTMLTYEPNGDNSMFRVQIMHVFGTINVRMPPTIAAAQLLTMLSRNTESFQTTTAFLGALQKSENGTIYATLNSFHHFMTCWHDADIAQALNLHLFDISMGLVTEDPSLTMLKQYGST